jgi:hypothetical protein
MGANGNEEVVVAVEILQRVVHFVVIDGVTVGMCEHVPKAGGFCHLPGSRLGQNTCLTECDHRSRVALWLTPVFVAKHRRGDVECGFGQLDKSPFDDVPCFPVGQVLRPGEGLFVRKDGQAFLTGLDRSDDSLYLGL